ncbi:MAG: sigma-70 family RNA polymerase sigma factor [bacterium]|nr:sigma-70 family RNA polymerase sigma factor [bacterium]
MELTFDEERNLVAGLKRGTDKAFQDLYRYFSSGLMGLFYRMTGDHDLSRDLFQETMIKIFEGVKYFREESRLYTWIYTIARNVALGHARKKRSEPALTVESERRVASTSLTPEEITVQKTSLEHLARCINDLDTDDRMIISLKLQTGLKYRGIAEIMGMTAGNVRVRMYRIREHLRTRMDWR